MGTSLALSLKQDRVTISHGLQWRCGSYKVSGKVNKGAQNSAPLEDLVSHVVVSPENVDHGLV
jgi:hypothetical protein